MCVDEDPDRPGPTPQAPRIEGRGEVGTVPVVNGQPDLSQWTSLGWTDGDGLTVGTPETWIDPTLVLADAGTDPAGMWSRVVTLATGQAAAPPAPAGGPAGEERERRAARQATRQAARAGRAAGSPGRGVDDVLADVDAATEGRCACGCGRPILAGSPSAYYATAGCQHRWMARHVDNPDQVYDRPDAALVGWEEDGGRVPLSGDVHPHRNHVHVEIRGTCAGWNLDRARPRPGQVYGPGTVPDELAYHRDCPACGQRMVPILWEPDDDITLFGDPGRVELPRWRIRQECSLCGASLAGPVFVPSVTPDPVDYDTGTGHGWTLHLSNVHSRVVTTLTAAALATHTPDRRRAVVDNMWTSMERDLARFDREWRGRVAGLHRHYLEAERLAAQISTDPPPTAGV